MIVPTSETHRYMIWLAMESSRHGGRIPREDAHCIKGIVEQSDKNQASLNRLPQYS